ncbi:LysR family transcriptional regulator [Magnetospira sp. QH-2]|uniref:LysR family transcriptional regulator n=1 Tax=Magnetospira sp. (strain QH-2) TaxID=1288970 RepID=UPI0003E81141|nr:LysR family transcriptional regulator [Magnetospira sp. QH-2]CCQ74995.1 RuBisCO operon transcriptional regulator [Magnetospira sp. QH-2]
MALHATLQQLRLFEAVARLGSITGAAREVHLTQPAVSIQIKRLEENAGLPLFDQVGRKLHLTAAGQVLLENSRAVLTRMVDLDSALESLRGEVAGPVRVSAVTTAQYFLPHLLGEFVRRHPGVQPSMAVTNRDSMIGRLEALLDDVYIMGQVPDRIDVVSTPFLENEIVIVAAPDHPLVSAGPTDLKSLLKERILLREGGSGTRQAFERLVAKNGLTVTPYMELGSGVALKQGVMAGLGVAVLSKHSLTLELALNRVAVLDCEGFPLHRPWYAVYPAQRQLPLAVSSFLEFLKTEGPPLVEALK